MKDQHKNWSNNKEKYGQEDEHMSRVRGYKTVPGVRYK